MNGKPDTVAYNDSSLLTTQYLEREIKHLEKLLTQRIDSVDRAVIVAHENLVRVPTEVDKAISHLHDVVDITLVAQKESVTKQIETLQESIRKFETTIGKQIDQQVLLIDTTNVATNAKIDDLKERFVRIEGQDKGSKNFIATIFLVTISIGAVIAIAIVLMK